MKSPVRVRELMLGLSAAAFWAMSAHAGSTVLDEVELTRILKSQPPCCVIDARSDANQKSDPLPDALRYRTDLNITPTAAVVVVADRDADAKSISEALSQKHAGKDIYAVKGGASAWRSVLKAVSSVSSSQAPGAPGGISFVIPRNTCENGAPLQILQSKPQP